jgi:hypothetical protein
MTIYEFFIESVEHHVRLEVPVKGLMHAVELFRRLDDYAAAGHGRVVAAQAGHSEVADLTLADARYLLEGIEQVSVGTPGNPRPGLLVACADALAKLPGNAALVAYYYEI